MTELESTKSPNEKIMGKIFLKIDLWKVCFIFWACLIFSKMGCEGYQFSFRAKVWTPHLEGFCAENFR
jgi:hypothetical protein